MSILDALAAIAKPEPKPIETGDYIKDAVFECAIFRLGLDQAEWMAEPKEEREFILKYLEAEYGNK